MKEDKFGYIFIYIMCWYSDYLQNFGNNININKKPIQEENLENLKHDEKYELMLKENE